MATDQTCPARIGNDPNTRRRTGLNDLRDLLGGARRQNYALPLISPARFTQIGGGVWPDDIRAERCGQRRDEFREKLTKTIEAQTRLAAL